MDPIADWTTFGLYWSTLSVVQRIWPTPNQSARRIIVPILPGSFIPSRAKTISVEWTSKKSTSASPTQFYIERSITPKLYVYATPDAADTFKYYALTRIQDAGSYSGNAEVPFRFLPCLVAGLAYYIAMKRAPERLQMLKAVYEEEFKRAMDEDRDRASFSAVPGRAYFNNY